MQRALERRSVLARRLCGSRTRGGAQPARNRGASSWGSRAVRMPRLPVRARGFRTWLRAGPRRALLPDRPGRGAGSGQWDPWRPGAAGSGECGVRGPTCGRRSGKGKESASKRAPGPRGSGRGLRAGPEAPWPLGPDSPGCPRARPGRSVLRCPGPGRASCSPGTFRGGPAEPRLLQRVVRTPLGALPPLAGSEVPGWGAPGVARRWRGPRPSLGDAQVPTPPQTLFN